MQSIPSHPQLVPIAARSRFLAVLPTGLCVKDADSPLMGSGRAAWDLLKHTTEPSPGAEPGDEAIHAGGRRYVRVRDYDPAWPDHTGPMDRATAYSPSFRCRATHARRPFGGGR